MFICGWQRIWGKRGARPRGGARPATARVDSGIAVSASKNTPLAAPPRRSTHAVVDAHGRCRLFALGAREDVLAVAEARAPDGSQLHNGDARSAGGAASIALDRPRGQPTARAAPALARARPSNGGS